MKHRLLYISLLATFALAGTAHAQDPCVSQFLGSSSHYELLPVALTPTPSEYVPVFVNYVGRNGASHVSYDIAATQTYITLQKADSAHALRGDGERLRKMLLIIQAVEKPKRDKLAQFGIEEMRSIGIRMLVNYKGIFQQRSCIKVSTIKVDKMTESADALLAGLGHKLDEPGCDKIDYNDDDNLRPFTVSKVLKDFGEKGDWKDNGESIRDKHADKQREKFLARFFNAEFLEALNDATQSKFVADMYNISLAINAIQPEITDAGHTWEDVNVRSFFSCSELELFNKANSAEEYYKSGPGDDKLGIQVKAAVPLLMGLMNSTDAYSLSKTTGVYARISTSETVASLAAIMNIKDANKPTQDANKFDRVWAAETIIPSAANIQWVLYQGTTPDTRTTYLVKFLLNEREVEIEGLKASNFPYYKWDDVKDFYKKKLSEDFEVENMAINTHNYLINLKQ